MRVFGVLGRALVRWPDARAELRQARVARRFDMMLFGCHASFGQLGQRRGQLEFICDDAAKLPYAAAPAPLSIAYIVAKGALEAQGRGGRKGTANFLQRAPIYPRALYYRTYRSSLLVPAVRARASPPHHSCLPWGFLSGEDINRTALWQQENDVVAAQVCARVPVP